MQEAVLAFGMACLVAFVAARFDRLRGAPMAFGPYLAASIGIGLGYEALPPWQLY